MSRVNTTGIDFIAEISSNWGTRDELFRSISQIPDSPALQWVKLQHYSERELYGVGNAEPNLPLSWLPDVKAAVNGIGCKFLLSVFSVPALLATIGVVDGIKIASSESSDHTLISIAAALCEQRQLPLFVSYSYECMEQAIEIARLLPPAGKLLYCPAGYPATHVDFRGIHTSGFSCHGHKYTHCIAAVEHGMKIIEKHINPLGLTDTPDAPHSLSSAEFEKLIAMCTKGLIERPPNPHQRRMVRPRIAV